MKKMNLLKYFSMVLIATLAACSSGSSSSTSSSNSTASTKTGTVISITLDAATIAKSRHAKAATTVVGTIADITSITADVSDASGYLVQGAQLTNTDGTWSVNLSDLPTARQLTFTAHAYNSTPVEIFTGSTSQMLTGSNDMVYITMSSSTTGVMQQFPAISGISRPSEIAAESTVAVSISVQGSSGETLSYEITPAENGGSFASVSGSLTLSGTLGTIVVNYTAPATTGVYSHAVKVTNSLGNSVQSSFDTTIVSQLSSSTVIVQFNPVVLGISAGLNGTDLTFSATVSDSGPASELSYAWSFSGGLGFVDNTINPAVMQGYTGSETGILMLQVANASGGHTTVCYMINANQFTAAAVSSTTVMPQTLHQIAGACQVAAVSGNIVALAIEEDKEGVDYNNDGDLSDRILGYFDVSTQQVVRTNIALNNGSVAIDGDIMAYRLESGNIGWYSISEQAGHDTAIVPDDFGRGSSAPTRVVSAGRIAYVASGKLNLYDISTGQNTTTLVAVSDATSVSFSGNIIAFVSQMGTIAYYDVASGALADTGEAGSYPTIDNGIIVYETAAGVVAYYDTTKSMNVLTPILYTGGYHASISNGIIAAAVPEDSYWGDMNGDGVLDGAGYLVLYDIPSGKMVSTGIKMCCGVDISGSIITVCQDNGCFQWYALLSDLVKGYFNR